MMIVSYFRVTYLTLYTSVIIAARVSIRQDVYSVNENSGTVTICARLRSPFPVRPDCQVHFTFSVPLVASPATADGVSYFTLCMSLLFIDRL